MPSSGFNQKKVLAALTVVLNVMPFPSGTILEQNNVIKEEIQLTCQLTREERFSTISLCSVRRGGPYWLQETNIFSHYYSFLPHI